MTTRKAKKVKPAPMKPWTTHPPGHIYAGFTNDRLYHASTVLEYAEESGSDVPDGMGYKVFEYTRTPSLAAKVEEVRRLCEVNARTSNIGGPSYGLAVRIIAILNTPTPPAKGAKRK